MDGQILQQILMKLDSIEGEQREMNEHLPNLFRIQDRIFTKSAPILLYPFTFNKPFRLSARRPLISPPA
ncbi:MAG TPA: hypothetical protein VL921_15995 [Candidatus Udaeobacter sp.]|nr:hypothetical protein [Candidatus Udaeobacter sp.]